MIPSYAELYDEFMKKPLVYREEPPRVAVEVDHWGGGAVRLRFQNVNLHVRHIPEAEAIRNRYIGRKQTHKILAIMEAEFNHWLHMLTVRDEIRWDPFEGKWKP